MDPPVQTTECANNELRSTLGTDAATGRRQEATHICRQAQGQCAHPKQAALTPPPEDLSFYCIQPHTSSHFGKGRKRDLHPGFPMVQQFGCSGTEETWLHAYVGESSRSSAFPGQPLDHQTAVQT